MNIVKKYWALVAMGLVLLAWTDARAATINAASGSRDDIQAAVVDAQIDDTVVVPGGTFEFVGTVTIGKTITLQGSGDHETILAMNNDSFIVGLQVTASNVTIRNLVLEGQEQGSGEILDYGISLEDVLDFRVLDCVLRDFGLAGINASGAYTKGVIAECEFIDIYREELGNYGYGVLVNGDGSTNWDRPFVLGNDDSVFVEDCSFIGNRHAIASNNGSRYVFRYNHTSAPRPENGTFVDAHGFEYGSDRGSRGYEVYGNILENRTRTPNWLIGIGIRGGDGVIFDNQLLDDSPDFEGYDHPILLACRMDETTTCDYPNQDQTRDLYLWNNTLNGEPTGLTIFSGHECLFEEGRDYYFYERPDYTPYTYPHPLRDEPECTDGQEQECYTGPFGTEGIGTCRAGTQTCVDGSWSTTCEGQVLPSAEDCDDDLDNDCDDLTDGADGEDCPAEQDGAETQIDGGMDGAVDTGLDADGADQGLDAGGEEEGSKDEDSGCSCSIIGT